MADWGIKISKPGVDVKTATPDQLVMSSAYNTLKVAKSDAPTGFGEYPHTLPFAPAFFVAAKLTSGSSYKWGFLGQEQSNAYEYTFACDSTKFYYAGECRYFLLYQDTL